MLEYLALGPIPTSTSKAALVYLHGTDTRPGGGAAASGVALTALPEGLAGVAAPRVDVSPYVARSGSLVKTRYQDGRIVALEGEVWGTDYADVQAKLDPILAQFARTPGSQFGGQGWPLPGVATSAPMFLQWRRQGATPHLSQEVYLAGAVVPVFDPVAPVARWRAEFVSPDRFAYRRADGAAGYTLPSLAVTVPAAVANQDSSAVAVGGTAPGRLTIAVSVPTNTGTTPDFTISLRSAVDGVLTFARWPQITPPNPNPLGVYTYDLAERIASSTGYAYPLSLIRDAEWFDLPPSTSGNTRFLRAATTVAGAQAGITVTATWTEAYL